MKKLNRKKDKRDFRDKLYVSSTSELPVSVDLFPNVPMILDQGDEGSCTAHGNAGCFQYLEAIDLKNKVVGAPEEFSAVFTPVSRSMIYAGERIMNGDLNADDGAQVRDGIKFLAESGVCAESIWPYTQATMFTVPSADAYSAAASHKITSYSRLTSLNDMKQCLASGFPFV